MNSPASHSQAKVRRTLTPTALVVRRIGLFLCALSTLIFGLIPFLLGVLTQVSTSRRLPLWLTAPFAAALLLVFWQFSGQPYRAFTFHGGNPLWPSVLFSSALFITFFAAGSPFIHDRRPPDPAPPL